MSHWYSTNRALLGGTAADSAGLRGGASRARFVERPAALLVDAGCIAAIEDPADARALAERDEVPFVDFGSCPIVPGWVSGHAHLAMAPLRGVASRASQRGDVVADLFFAIESRLSPEDVRCFTALGAHEALLAGVTEVWDHYYFGEQVAAALADVGLPGVVAPTLQDLGGPRLTSPDEVLRATEAILASEHLATRGVRAALGVHAADTVSAELFASAASVARRLEIPVHMHYLQSSAEVLALAARGEPMPTRTKLLLERTDGLRLVLAHCLFASDEEVTDLATSGATLAHCPWSQVQFGFLGPLGAWRRAGGGIALGGDTVASNDAVEPSRELLAAVSDAALAISYGQERRELARGAPGSAAGLEAARQQAVPAESDALDLLGAALGFDLPGGPRGLVVGAPASFVVLDARHPALGFDVPLTRLLLHGSLTSAIHQVFARGRPVGEAGRLASSVFESADYRALHAEARERTRSLFNRARVSPLT